MKSREVCTEVMLLSEDTRKWGRVAQVVALIAFSWAESAFAVELQDVSTKAGEMTQSAQRASTDADEAIKLARASAKDAKAIDAKKNTDNAEKKIKAARVQIKDAQKKLDEARVFFVQVTNPEEKAEAELVIAKAETALSDAKQKLAEAERETAEAALETAKVCRRCAYLGVIAASGTVAGVIPLDEHDGVASHTLVSGLLPTVGMRWQMAPVLSIGFGAVTMLLSKDLTSSAERVPCRKDDTNDFERRLPCVGSSSITPVGALFFEVSLGDQNAQWVTAMPMFGAATVSLDNTVHPFFGLAVGVASFSQFAEF